MGWSNTWKENWGTKRIRTKKCEPLQTCVYLWVLTLRFNRDSASFSVDVVLLLAACSRSLSLRSDLVESECIVSGKENQKATHHVHSLALLPSISSIKNTCLCFNWNSSRIGVRLECSLLTSVSSGSVHGKPGKWRSGGSQINTFILFYFGILHCSKKNSMDVLLGCFGKIHLNFT